MITAKEALEMVDTINRDKFDFIPELIRKAANKGKYSIVLNFPLNNIQINELESNGYQLKYVGVEYNHEISWQFEK